jgi:hypothetical protein
MKPATKMRKLPFDRVAANVANADKADLSVRGFCWRSIALPVRRVPR